MQALATRSPEKVLETLLWPCPAEEFATSIREQGALLVQRESARSFYSGIFSSEELWKLLSEHRLEYGTSVDVTLFTPDRRRETFNNNELEGAHGVPHSSGVGTGRSPSVSGSKRKGKKRKKSGLMADTSGAIPTQVQHPAVCVTAFVQDNNICDAVLASELGPDSLYPAHRKGCLNRTCAIPRQQDYISSCLLAWHPLSTFPGSANIPGQRRALVCTIHLQSLVGQALNYRGGTETDMLT